MKNIKFLLGLLTIVVIMASCVTTQGGTDDEYMNDPRAQQMGNRLYLQDPYNGTVVLERDPVTGRYYDVTYGSRYGTGYYGNYPYGGYYGGRGYSRGGVYNRDGGSYGRGGSVIQQQPQTPSREEIRQNREEARKTILGSPRQ